jgi:hypothetical protein
LRLFWHDACLPTPELQYWIYSDEGVALYRLDIAAPEVRYAAEYDGDEFHTSAEDREHDEYRRSWIAEHRSWVIDPFTKAHVYQPSADPVAQLMEGFAAARRATSLWTPRRRSA